MPLRLARSGRATGGGSGGSGAGAQNQQTSATSSTSPIQAHGGHRQTQHAGLVSPTSVSSRGVEVHTRSTAQGDAAASENVGGNQQDSTMADVAASRITGGTAVVGSTHNLRGSGTGAQTGHVAATAAAHTFGATGAGALTTQLASPGAGATAASGAASHTPQSLGVQAALSTIPPLDEGPDPATLSDAAHDAAYRATLGVVLANLRAHGSDPEFKTLSPHDAGLVLKYYFDRLKAIDTEYIAAVRTAPLMDPMRDQMFAVLYWNRKRADPSLDEQKLLQTIKNEFILARRVAAAETRIRQMADAQRVRTQSIHERLATQEASLAAQMTAAAKERETQIQRDAAMAAQLMEQEKAAAGQSRHGTAAAAAAASTLQNPRTTMVLSLTDQESDLPRIHTSRRNGPRRRLFVSSSSSDEDKPEAPAAEHDPMYDDEPSEAALEYDPRQDDNKEEDAQDEEVEGEMEYDFAPDNLDVPLRSIRVRDLIDWKVEDLLAHHSRTEVQAFLEDRLGPTLLNQLATRPQNRYRPGRPATSERIRLLLTALNRNIEQVERELYACTSDDEFDAAEFDAAIGEAQQLNAAAAAPRPTAKVNSALRIRRHHMPYHAPLISDFAGPVATRPTSGNLRRLQLAHPAGFMGNPYYFYVGDDIIRELEVLRAAEHQHRRYDDWARNWDPAKERLRVDEDWDEISGFEVQQMADARVALRRLSEAYRPQWEADHKKPRPELGAGAPRADREIIEAAHASDARLQRFSIHAMVTEVEKELHKLKEAGQWTAPSSQVLAAEQAAHTLLRRAASTGNNEATEKKAAAALTRLGLLQARGSTPYAADLLEQMERQPGVNIGRLLGYMRSHPSGPLSSLPLPARLRSPALIRAHRTVEAKEGDEEEEEEEAEVDLTAETDAPMDEEELQAVHTGTDVRHEPLEAEGGFHAAEEQNRLYAATSGYLPNEFVASNSEYEPIYDEHTGQPIGRERVLSLNECAQRLLAEDAAYLPASSAAAAAAAATKPPPRRRPAPMTVPYSPTTPIAAAAAAALGSRQQPIELSPTLHQGELDLHDPAIANVLRAQQQQTATRLAREREAETRAASILGLAAAATREHEHRHSHRPKTPEGKHVHFSEAAPTGAGPSFGGGRADPSAASVVRPAPKKRLATKKPRDTGTAAPAAAASSAATSQSTHHSRAREKSSSPRRQARTVRAVPDFSPSSSAPPDDYEIFSDSQVSLYKLADDSGSDGDSEPTWKSPYPRDFYPPRCACPYSGLDASQEESVESQFARLQPHWTEWWQYASATSYLVRHWHNTRPRPHLLRGRDPAITSVKIAILVEFSQARCCLECQRLPGSIDPLAELWTPLSDAENERDFWTHERMDRLAALILKELREGQAQGTCGIYGCWEVPNPQPSNAARPALTISLTAPEYEPQPLVPRWSPDSPKDQPLSSPTYSPASWDPTPVRNEDRRAVAQMQSRRLVSPPPSLALSPCIKSEAGLPSLPTIHSPQPPLLSSPVPMEMSSFALSPLPPLLARCRIIKAATEAATALPAKMSASTTGANGSRISLDILPWMGTADKRSAQEFSREFTEWLAATRIDVEQWEELFKRALHDRYVKATVEHVPISAAESLHLRFARVLTAFHQAHGTSVVEERALRLALRNFRRGPDERPLDAVIRFFKCLESVPNGKSFQDGLMQDADFQTFIQGMGEPFTQHARPWIFGEPDPNSYKAPHHIHIRNRGELISSVRMFYESRNADQRKQDFIVDMVHWEKTHGSGHIGPAFSIHGVVNKDGEREHGREGWSRLGCFDTPEPSKETLARWADIKRTEDLSVWGYKKPTHAAAAAHSAPRPRYVPQRAHEPQHAPSPITILAPPVPLQAPRGAKRSRDTAQARQAVAVPMAPAAAAAASSSPLNKKPRRDNRPSPLSAANSTPLRAASVSASSEDNQPFSWGPCPNCAMRHNWQNCPRNKDGDRFNPESAQYLDTGAHPRARPEDCAQVHLAPPVNRFKEEDAPYRRHVRLVQARINRLRCDHHGQAEVVVSCQFGQLPVQEGLVDSGAHVSLLSYKYYLQHHMHFGPLHVTRYTLVLADGQAVSARGQVTALFTAFEDLTGRAYTVKHEFIIVEGMETTLILGMDINQKLFHSLIFRKGHLIFNPASIDHVRISQTQRTPSAALLVAQSIHIPGNSVREVPVTLFEPNFPPHSTLEVEAGSIHSTSGEIMHLDFAPHIRSSSSPQQGAQPYSIVIRNRDLRALRLEKGCVIGRAHVVPAAELCEAPPGRYAVNAIGEVTLATRPQVLARTIRAIPTDMSDVPAADSQL